MELHLHSSTCLHEGEKKNIFQANASINLFSLKYSYEIASTRNSRRYGGTATINRHTGFDVNLTFRDAMSHRNGWPDSTDEASDSSSHIPNSKQDCGWQYVTRSSQYVTRSLQSVTRTSSQYVTRSSQYVTGCGRHIKASISRNEIHKRRSILDSEQIYNSLIHYNGER